MPFEKLVEELKVDMDTSRHPIFQVMFMVQSFGVESLRKHDLLESYYQDGSYSIAKFDITTVIKTYKHILMQLSELTNKSKIKVSDLSYLSCEDYLQVVNSWKQTSIDCFESETIHELFEKQAAKTPNAIAVVYEGRRLTYKELSEKSTQLAHYLYKTYAIRPDDLIALCLSRSEHLLIAILGVLKSGGAYVSLDYKYPDERIGYIIFDIKSKVVLTEGENQERLSKIISGF